MFIIIMNGDPKQILSGYNAQHMMVQHTTRENIAVYAKKFATKAAAKRYAERYVSGGYGLASYEIEEVPNG